MEYEPIPEYLDKIGKEIVDAAYCVHKSLGPGLLECVYEECMIYELRKRGYLVNNQCEVPIEYDGQIIESSRLRLDLLVEREVIIELKAVETMNPLYKAQLMTYLRLSKLRLGYLINFNVPLIKEGIKRIVM